MYLTLPIDACLAVHHTSTRIVLLQTLSSPALRNLLRLHDWCRNSKDVDALTDRQFSLLMNTGLLTRDVGKQNSYLFAVAGAGKLVTSISKGRKVSNSSIL